MRRSYDFSEARPNPYVKQLKQQITIRLDADVVSYFKALTDETGIPYQTLINLYLRDCMLSEKRPALSWRPRASASELAES